MYKSLFDLESNMRSVLKSLSRSTDYDLFLTSLPSDWKNALRECVDKGYTQNISYMLMSGGFCSFNNHGNIYISEQGLRFLHNTSPSVKIGRSVLNVLKGASGYFLGILSTVIADLIVLQITGEEILSKVLQELSKFLP